MFRLLVKHVSSWPSAFSSMLMLVVRCNAIVNRATLVPDNLEIYLHSREACVVNGQHTSIRGGHAVTPFLFENRTVDLHM